MSLDDDNFIESILDEDEGKKRPRKSTDKEMSDHPKEKIQGQSVVSAEGSANIDDFLSIKRKAAIFRKQNGLDKYKMDEIHVKEGKIVVDEEKYKERIKKEEQLMKNDAEISAQSRVEGHTIENPLPKFDPNVGFKPYNKEKWDKDGELELV